MEIDETEKKLHPQEETEPSAISDNDSCNDQSSYDKDSENLIESQEEYDPYFEEFYKGELIRQRIKDGDKTALKDLKKLNAEIEERVRREGFNKVPDYADIVFQGDAPSDLIDRQLAGAGSYQMQSTKINHQIQFAVSVARQGIGDNLRYSDDDKFRLYNGSYWEVVSEMYVGIKLKDFALRIGCYALDMQMAGSIKTLIEQAKFDFYAQFEGKRGLLNLKNGTYDFTNDEFREQRPDDCLEYVEDYDYDPSIKSKVWDDFLNDILPPDILQVLQEGIGNTFLDHRHEKMVYAVGGGCNGKSTLLEGIGASLGQGNITNFTLAQVTEEDGKARGSMIGKLLNISADNSQKIKDFGVLKSYVSGEGLSAKKVYQDIFTTNNLPKTIIAANALPRTEDLSDGYFRRLLIIPFERQIPKDKIDVDLKSKLIKERAGILNWIIEGARRLRKQGKFSESQAINNYLERYRRDSDTVALFVDEKGLEAGNDKHELASEVFTRYDEWRYACGYARMGTRIFYSRLEALGFEFQKISGEKRMWRKNFDLAGVDEDSMPF